MQTLTELVAAVVVHSSAVAYSHFGVTIEPHQPERPVAAARKVARSTPARSVDNPNATPLGAPLKAGAVAAKVSEGSCLRRTAGVSAA
ncbi:hypothetical protein [Phenylobacterium sp.]|uniref:hypothetical protein n=1 Tax=Phenylobacterium sp. TaxID=1871053 RepID=UPI0027300E0E|nr:hypothetical protein [Phenylobacterium sp.]MDP1616841.1 hypothetical protein [Phenylobacterium sp.]MDP1987571.1 hypothetical protein [Phenylobacterium sp.]